MGAKVYMAAPDEQQTKDALARVEREGREPGLGEVLWHELDLKDPRDAKASAERFMQKESKLDILSMSHNLFSSTPSNIITSTVNNAAQLVVFTHSFRRIS